MEKESDKKVIRRYLNGTYLMSEVDDLHDNMRRVSIDNEAMDEMASEVWDEGADEGNFTPFSEKESYREARKLVNGLKSSGMIDFRRWGYTLAGIAALFILIFLGVQGIEMYQDSQLKIKEVTTGYGETKQVMLADGSKVVLNACSTLKYPEHFTGDMREVNLQGQAFFEVARNEEQPFSVQTSKFHVQVLGTEFDVKSYVEDETVSVEVKSGKVEVTLPEATLRLKKAEQMFMNTVSGDFNKKNEKKEVASWRKGTLSFNHTPIRDVAHELERIYHCKIKFCKEQDFASVITGEHGNQSLISVLESLHFVSGLNYRKEADGSIFIYK